MTDTADDIALGQLAAREVNADNGGLPAGLPMPRDPGLLTDFASAATRHSLQPAALPVPRPERLVHRGRVDRPRAR